MLFTTPIWLFAAVAISIPVVVHLWNIKQGKTLKVGSISLFNESSPTSSRSLKLLDILLLILRCMLLMLLALLLAAPLWQQHIKTTKAKGWILIPATNSKETYNKFKPIIDSLTKKGYEFHNFNTNFDKLDTAELRITPAVANKNSNDSLNYWGLVNRLSTRISPGTAVELFTPNSAAHFTGSKPTTGLNIHWHTYIPADSVTNWLAGAWLTSSGSVRILQGASTPTGTSYQNIELKNGSQNGYSVSIDNGAPFVNFKNEKIKVDTTINRIAIYPDKNAVDANYLKSALLAIAQLTQRKTVIKLYNQADAIPLGQNWIYWLTDKPAGSQLPKTKNLFSYEAGKVNEVNSWITNNPQYTLTPDQPKIALSKSIDSKIIGNAIWTDGFGNPMLSIEHIDNLNVYHFYSHLNPIWNDLVWSDEFPKWMLALTQPATDADNVHNRRILSDAQIQPETVAIADNLPGQQTLLTDLTRYLWLAMVLVFFAERWLATKNKMILANG